MDGVEQGQVIGQQLEQGGQGRAPEVKQELGHESAEGQESMQEDDDDDDDDDEEEEEDDDDGEEAGPSCGTRY